jgi:hypothetical protein
MQGIRAIREGKRLFTDLKNKLDPAAYLNYQDHFYAGIGFGF